MAVFASKFACLFKATAARVHAKFVVGISQSIVPFVAQLVDYDHGRGRQCFYSLLIHVLVASKVMYVVTPDVAINA